VRCAQCILFLMFCGQNSIVGIAACYGSVRGVAFIALSIAGVEVLELHLYFPAGLL
jgi:hypothetical protein